MSDTPAKTFSGTPNTAKAPNRALDDRVRPSPRTSEASRPKPRAPSPRGPKTKPSQYDRFIPNRQALDMASTQLALSRSDTELDEPTRMYHAQVARACGVSLDTRILKFKESAPVSDRDDLRQITRPVLKPHGTKRRILTTPERVLDAPGLVDDYYLNLLDWSTSNVLAIGLDQSVYLWNATSGDVDSLCELEGDVYVASVKWTGDGAYLAVGTSNGDVEIWDAEARSKIRTMGGRQSRVGVLSWERHMV
ncbi:WD repeat-containing protein slp1, partial [Coemansia sp. RSA 788]